MASLLKFASWSKMAAGAPSVMSTCIKERKKEGQKCLCHLLDDAAFRHCSAFRYTPTSPFRQFLLPYYWLHLAAVNLGKVAFALPPGIKSESVCK